MVIWTKAIFLTAFDTMCVGMENGKVVDNSVTSSLLPNEVLLPEAASSITEDWWEQAE